MIHRSFDQPAAWDRLKPLFGRKNTLVVRQRSTVRGAGGPAPLPRSHPADLPIRASAYCSIKIPVAENPYAALSAYLQKRGNTHQEIQKTLRLLAMPGTLLEIGCGGGEAALAIAEKNPRLGIVATDRYDCTDACTPAAGYRKVALQWQAHTLGAQRADLSNLVLLRAEASLLRCLPDKSIDAVLMVNPEPAVGKIVIDLLDTENLIAKVRPGNRRLVVLPYSREMGAIACGGYEFEHDADWSRGLGFLKSSRFDFHRAVPVQWGVDLQHVSGYSGHSTQQDVYVFGDRDPAQQNRPNVPVHRRLLKGLRACLTARIGKPQNG